MFNLFIISRQLLSPLSKFVLILHEYNVSIRQAQLLSKFPSRSWQKYGVTLAKAIRKFRKSKEILIKVKKRDIDLPIMLNITTFPNLFRIRLFFVDILFVKRDKQITDLWALEQTKGLNLQNTLSQLYILT